MDFERKKDMTRFKLPHEIETAICEHEDKMLKIYKKIFEEYEPVVLQYGCAIKIERIWSNCFKKGCSVNRLPFKVGYECSIQCEIQKNGKLVEVKCTDGEVDYEPLFAVSAISRIDFKFFNKEKGVVMNDDTDDIKEQLDDMIELLSTNGL